MKQINAIFLCCGRDDLFQKTINSFVEKVVNNNKDYQFRFIIYDDSGDEKKRLSLSQIIEQDLREFSKTFLFSENNLGQAKAVLNLLKNCNLKDDDLIFFCEEDFEFVEEVSLKDMINLWNEKESIDVSIRQVILLTDAFEKHEITLDGLRRSNRNIVSYEPDFYVLGTNLHRDICSINFGGALSNDDYCFHPHLTKFKFLNVFNDNDIGPKSCGEDVIGLKGLNHCRLWLTKKVFANHIGHYRYYSVFPGAKVRSKVSSNIDSAVTLKQIR